MSVNLADLQSELRSSVKELNPDVLCGSTELQPSPWVPASVTTRVLHIHGNDASSLSLATYRDGLSQRVCSWTLPNGRPQACSSPSMFLLTTNSTHDQHEPEPHDHPAGHELGAGADGETSQPGQRHRKRHKQCHCPDACLTKVAHLIEDISQVLHEVRAANPEDKAHAVAQLRTEPMGFLETDLCRGNGIRSAIIQPILDSLLGGNCDALSTVV